MLKNLQYDFNSGEWRTSKCTRWLSNWQRNQRSNHRHLLDHEKAREFQRNIYFCFTEYVKDFTMWATTFRKISKEMGVQIYLTCFLRYLYMGQETTVWMTHETMDWFKIGKEYDKAVYCHPAHLTYIQSTSGEMLGLMNHRLE